MRLAHSTTKDMHNPITGLPSVLLALPILSADFKMSHLIKFLEIVQEQSLNVLRREVVLE